MKSKTAAAVAGLLTIFLVCSPLAADAKKWTVTQRLEKLSKEIDEGRTGNELTTKQVEDLKKEVSDIKDRMEKMKSKNGGKLSIPDTNKVHKELNDLSVKTLRLRLDNVYKP
ncbi:hypothetical protein KF707_08090 [Candidatus Obscuribacterales bacterium]|jgi:septal ring factor EnvC (AmiA/AmiB activator)|nr:hypothetical protein [Candidatus Obscuribacterales bacterium]MBX3136182.1 hypothetical protein [Candidatus Obscuribacterales bacterium]MBX3151167.1 hypothetical protein [Candidatus Obscuribacterales bacterium]